MGGRTFSGYRASMTSTSKRHKQFQVRARRRKTKYLATMTAAVRNVHEALVSGCDYVELRDRKNNTTICYDSGSQRVYSR